MAESISQRDWILADSVLIRSLREDIGNGDVTTLSLIPEKHTSRSVLIARGNLVLAGLSYAKRVFELVDHRTGFTTLKKDGDQVNAGEVIARVRGNTGSLLRAERVALNLLQRLSGIASLTDKYIQAVRGLNVIITDTRKTAPGLRFFDKYAVRTGGGKNHRYGLYDGILIKDNHIAAVGGVSRAIKRARKNAHHLLKIEVEVNNITEVKAAVSAGADAVMLDNMPVDMIEKAVGIIRSRCPHIVIEASGNIDLETVRSIAETGVDVISVGSLTHSAPAADVSMEMVSP